MPPEKTEPPGGVDEVEDGNVRQVVALNPTQDKNRFVFGQDEAGGVPDVVGPGRRLAVWSNFNALPAGTEALRDLIGGAGCGH